MRSSSIISYQIERKTLFAIISFQDAKFNLKCVGIFFTDSHKLTLVGLLPILNKKTIEPALIFHIHQRGASIKHRPTHMYHLYTYEFIWFKQFHWENFECMINQTQIGCMHKMWIFEIFSIKFKHFWNGCVMCVTSKFKYVSESYFPGKIFLN